MRWFDAGAQDEPREVHDRVLTVPNALSLVRLLALPLVYADLAGGRHLRGLVVLVAVAATDWLDGYIARRFDQVTRVGTLLDPIVDRGLVVAVGVGMVVGDLLPLWAAAVVLARDLAVLVGGLVLVSRGVGPPPVTRLGKAATAGLMVALPLLILASVLEGHTAEGSVRATAWVTFAGSVALYYAAAVQYALLVRSDVPPRPSADPDASQRLG